MFYNRSVLHICISNSHLILFLVHFYYFEMIRSQKKLQVPLINHFISTSHCSSYFSVLFVRYIHKQHYIHTRSVSFYVYTIFYSRRFRAFHKEWYSTFVQAWWRPQNLGFRGGIVNSLFSLRFEISLSDIYPISFHFS